MLFSSYSDENNPFIRVKTYEAALRDITDFMTLSENYFIRTIFTTPSTSHQTPCIPNNRFPHQEYHP